MNTSFEELADFLKEANRHTYADENAPKAASLRPGSTDFHFEKDGLIYHDTYFGSRDFIGGEVVYKEDKPVWGMNYFGWILDDNEHKKDVYGFLRKALLADYEGLLQVRGPEKFAEGEWEYRFKSTGDLANFSGEEEIARGGKVVYRLIHGGFVE